MSDCKHPDHGFILHMIYVALVVLVTFEIARAVDDTASVEYAAWSHARGAR